VLVGNRCDAPAKPARVAGCAGSVKAPSWAPDLPSGASVTIGFQANGPASPAASGFRLGDTDSATS
jgi:hypothetical protein